jgi:hypothetical protein
MRKLRASYRTMPRSQCGAETFLSFFCEAKADLMASVAFMRAEITSWEGRLVRLAQGGVRQLVQRDAVLFLTLPAQRSNGVEALTRCRQRRRQDLILVRRDLKSDAHSAVHTSCMRVDLDSFKASPRFLCRVNATVSTRRF